MIGWGINRSRNIAERRAASNPLALRLSGGIITTTIVGGATLTGWGIEQVAHNQIGALQWLGSLVVVISLASALAGQSLKKAVNEVIEALPNLDEARGKLSWIVGRDTAELGEQNILRAAAETASENAVDGLFAPLFWMLSGCALWQFSPLLPGPVALAWMFKASSTLDSMLGYRRGSLRWLGTAGAKLDDLLTWLPCRLVVLSLPMVSRPWHQAPKIIRTAFKDAASDPSPNAGLSEAIFAHCAGVQMGGHNTYQGIVVEKPTLAQQAPHANREGVENILRLISRLEIAWIGIAIVSNLLI